jgi:flagellar basal-body rod protein FlgF
MIKGLYSAASAMIVGAARQQVIAQNIANLKTPGFKQVLTTVEDFMKTGVTYSPANILRDQSQRYIGSIGLGAETGPDFVDFTQGGLESTENLYDLAIQGNGFFRVSTADGTRYTRDGRFLRNTQNKLVTVEGYAVLNDSNQPITLPEGTLSVGQDGTLSVNGTVVTKLGISAFAKPETELNSDKGNLFAGPAQSTTQVNAQVAQGYLEMSNSNPSYLMTEMIQVARSYEAAQKMVQNQDELLGKTISSLGRIG